MSEVADRLRAIVVWCDHAEQGQVSHGTAVVAAKRLAEAALVLCIPAESRQVAEGDVMERLRNRPVGLLDYDAAAQYLGVTSRHLRTMVAERQIRHRRLGRLVRFTQEDLDQFHVERIVETV